MRSEGETTSDKGTHKKLKIVIEPSSKKVFTSLKVSVYLSKKTV